MLTMNSHRILVVDDEKLISWSISTMLEKAGHSVATAASGTEALQKFQNFRPEVVLLDISLPDMSGLEILARVKEENEDVTVIMITANSNADEAVTAFQRGADDFFGKPFCLETLRHVVDKALERMKLKKEVDIFRRERRKKGDFDQLVGRSSKMVEVFKLINVCSRTDAKTVLITGESGTGKELVARAVHLHSARSDRPFIEVNCAAIPENLLENELFGHEKGAFTDASRKQKGIFELAEGGTVFLDEIGDMPLQMQAKLLKVMETKRFRRLGGEDDVEADVRIIAATNQNLPKMVADGGFRGDLFFRLNVMNIRLPPLRERSEDIPTLVSYFIRRLNDEYGRSVEGISDDALATLTGHNWPGNVRELRNSVERAMMLEPSRTLRLGSFTDDFQCGGGATESSPVPAGSIASDAPGTLSIRLPSDGLSIEEVEKQLIILALERTGGNQTKAAQYLKMTRDTLRYRMKKFGLSESGWQDDAGDDKEGELGVPRRTGRPTTTWRTL
ncbi:sigma-54 dependent transcriptional regulator [Geobacter sp. 60473]|nr:sigma-54 dependent transcriptional regulator [Geobacter sp. 60473]